MNASPPEWNHCGIQATAQDPVGCRGVTIGDTGRCLAHAADTVRGGYLGGLTPGADIDLRGTLITAEVLGPLLDAVRNPETGAPEFGNAAFSAAEFGADVRFEGATFHGDADFAGAAFTSAARFDGVSFNGDVVFDDVHFAGATSFSRSVFGEHAAFNFAAFGTDARFSRSHFAGIAGFSCAEFGAHTGFEDTVFESAARFTAATFTTYARFDGATFEDIGEFTSSEFRRGAWFGKSRFQGTVDFDGSRVGGSLQFNGASFAVGPWFMAATGMETLGMTRTTVTEPTVTQVTAQRLDLTDARVEAPLTLKAGGTEIDLTNAVLTDRLTITSMHHHVAQAGLGPRTDPLSRRPSVTSLSGVDASMVLFFDVDLSSCTFTGAHSLDQLNIEGSCTFGRPPAGLFRMRRRIIVEEARWRKWRTDGPVPGPATLADTYRQLRKAREDAKDEPGAADFYYGEMEMRRHSRRWSEAERWLLQAYWLVSGYGLRASRSLCWLVASMLVTILLLLGFGLPQTSPEQYATGTVPPGGGKVTLVLDKRDPANPTGDRFTGKRFTKALTLTLNSVVFRSSGQDLTTAGGYIEMASRFSEPILLGLAALAVRGRVKR